ncbi:Zinc transporter ZitB [Paraburkholderia domus]|jgi:cation diffusion facilitator family transporter|uniref:cation diffusion facilitator family transporter n=1 Tax=Paraburkholderia domus TaxID=2793075 RepID=UPI00191206E6|nr:cation diffusion facilitator family transporter [Paraburkholderia domus]MBK5047165.1 cation transporter [Burkholderia sp. R-70006]MBK5086088.1 cation transporter [Burkholderia sp. R-69927]MBK5119115.1 cation transporter [Burkholderia sp. R-69980]MBK5178952.1 cation transporter [Burkholderia sp. R-69749]MCI0145234.1 cation diffusion facilitator family transporter [Paraburkholderia sediminicola]
MKKTTTPNRATEEREDDHAPVWLKGEFDGVDDADAQVEGKERGSQDHGAHEPDANTQDALECGSHDADHAHSHGADGHGGQSGSEHGHDSQAGHNHSHSHSRSARGHAGHSHTHAHAPVAGHGRAFALAVALNVAIVVVQAVYGVIAHSTALLADAGHNLSDVLGLLLAWGATWLAARRPSARYTFGYGSSSILASLANAGLLLFACGVIVAEAIGRLMNPAPVAGLVVFVVATVGVVVNGFSAWLFMRGQKDDLNLRGAFLHMAADAAISAAVAISGLVILYTSWTWLDPVMSLLVVAVVVVGTWGLLRDSVRMALDAVPPGVDLQNIRDYLAEQPGVTDVHDLHVWALSTTGNALSAHLVMPAGHPGDESIDGIVVTLRERFSMQHATLQVDLGTTEHRCAMDHSHD